MTGLVIFVAAAVVLSVVVAMLLPLPPISVQSIYAEYVLNEMKREGLIK